MTTRRKRSAKSPRIEALIGEDRELFKGLLKESLQEVLEAEMTETVGAGLGERTAVRTGYRSGYYSRGLVTRIGKLELRVPRDREGRFSTELFDRFQRSEKALVSALAEMYVQGVSTRKVKAVTEELCGHTFSASTVSRINKSLDGLLRRFAHRPARRGVSLSDPRCAVREGPARRGDPVAGGLHRDRDQRRGPAPNPGRGALESRVALELDDLRHQPLNPGAPRRGVRRLRRPCRTQAGGAGAPARGRGGSGVTCTSSAMPSTLCPRKADDDCRQELRWLNFVRREVCVAERLQQLDSGVLRQMQLVPLRKLHESLVLRFPSTGGQLCRSFLNCLGHDNGGARQSPSSRTNAHTASSPFFLQLSGLE